MALPSHIARYKVVQPIAAGGMGEVFLARDEKLDRLVAIKLLREGFDSPDLHERFEEEARNVAKLTHPNIVTIYEFGTHDERPYIAMEYIAGHSLAEIIKRQLPLSVARRIRLVEEACSGLAHAHKAHLVHRDVKPANLMMTTSGLVKVLDFGIAKLRGTERTQKGMIVGTVNYMSPEQITGQPVDHRSDVFAVGAVLYEILTFDQAFKGNLATAMFAIVHGQPEPLAVRCPGLDPAFQVILDRCLAKSPDDRYQDLTQLKRELGRLRRPLEDAEDADAPDTAAPVDVDQTLVVKTPKPPSTISGRGPGPDTRRALGSALASGEAAMTVGQFESAIRYADQALALEAENISAHDLMARAVKAHEGARVAAQVRVAREALSGDRLEEARAALGAATALAPESNTVRGLVRQLDQRAADLEHFDKTVAHARERFEARDFAAARDLTESIAHIRLDHSALKRLRDEIDRADAKYKAWLATELAAIDDIVARQDFSAAVARAEAAAAKAPHAHELVNRANQIRAAREAVARADEARRREVDEHRRAEEDRGRQIAALLETARDLREPAPTRRDAASAVLALDRGHEDAATIVARLTAEIARAERQQALDRAREAEKTKAALASADAAATAGRFGEAIAQLNALDAGDHAVKAALDRVRAAAAADAKRRRRAERQGRLTALAADWRVMSGVGVLGAAVLVLWLWPRGTTAPPVTGPDDTAASGQPSQPLAGSGGGGTGPGTAGVGSSDENTKAADPGGGANGSGGAGGASAGGDTRNVAKGAGRGAPSGGLEAEPPPSRTRIARAGVDVPEPRRITHVAPEYPAEALAKRVEGSVTADITIGLDGAVTNVAIRRSVPGLDTAARTALMQWRYSQTQQDGQRVSVAMTVDVPFALPPTGRGTAPDPGPTRDPGTTSETTPGADGSKTDPTEGGKPNPPPPPPPTKTDEGAVLRQADQATLGEIVGRFGAAYQDENLAGLKRAWPGMSRETETAYRNVFQSYSRLGWTLQSEEWTVSDDRSKATTICGVQVALTELRSNSTRYERRSYRFSFERRATGWTLVNVENLGAVR